MKGRLISPCRNFLTLGANFKTLISFVIRLNYGKIRLHLKPFVPKFCLPIKKFHQNFSDGLMVSYGILWWSDGFWWILLMVWWFLMVSGGFFWWSDGLHWISLMVWWISSDGLMDFFWWSDGVLLMVWWFDGFLLMVWWILLVVWWIFSDGLTV